MPSVAISPRALAGALLTLALVVALLAVAPPARSAAVARFEPTADAWVDEDRPSRNHGAGAALRVRGAAGGQRSYLTFAVGDVALPAEATLRLYVREGGEHGASVSRVKQAWSESKITWRNAPAPSGAALAAIRPAREGAWIDVDLGRIITVDGVYSFTVTGTGSDGVEFRSRQSGKAPELIVTGSDRGETPDDPDGEGDPDDNPDDEEEAPAPPPPPGSGIWIGADETAALPTSGDAWRRLTQRAGSDIGEADIADQDSRHDIDTLAVALVAARTGDASYRAKAVANLLSVIGTEHNADAHCGYAPSRARSMTIARNLAGYVIAADVLGVRPGQHPDGGRFAAWVDKVRRTKNCPNTGGGSWTPGEEPGDTISEAHDNSGSNGSAMAGGARLAAALYLGDDGEVRRAWDTFRRYSGDRNVGPDLSFNADGLSWAHDRANPVAVNPQGANINGHRIDGAIINDIGRGGAFTWPPGHTGYQWEGIQGYVVQAELLQRAGYQAWEVGDRAPLRTVDFMHDLAFTDPGDASWWGKAAWTVALTNAAYGTDLPAGPADGGKNMAWTDWTHAR